jgi:hypothetical protein
MISSPSRCVLAASAVLPLVVACSSGPEPSEAVWVRWTAETTHQDTEEMPELKVCGHAAKSADSKLGVDVAVDVERTAEGGIRVIVPVEAGGTVRRVVTRELVVGRWPYGGSKSEASYWVKDGDPLPEGLDEPTDGKGAGEGAPAKDKAMGPVAVLAAERRPVAGSEWVPIARALPVSGSLEIYRQAAPAGAPRILKSSRAVLDGGKGVLEFEISAAELDSTFPNRGRDPDAGTSVSPRFELYVVVNCGSTPPVSTRIRRQPVLTDRDLFQNSNQAGR